MDREIRSHAFPGRPWLVIYSASYMTRIWGQGKISTGVCIFFLTTVCDVLYSIVRLH